MVYAFARNLPIKPFWGLRPITRRWAFNVPANATTVLAGSPISICTSQVAPAESRILCSSSRAEFTADVLESRLERGPTTDSESGTTWSNVSFEWSFSARPDAQPRAIVLCGPCVPSDLRPKSSPSQPARCPLLPARSVRRRRIVAPNSLLFRRLAVPQTSWNRFNSLPPGTKSQ